MQDGKLEVGDSVYCANRSRYGKDIKYLFKIVKRVTATQAILEDGEKLKNEISKDWLGNERFIELGSRDSWYLTTSQVLEDAKKEAERQKANSWFNNQQFTDEQKQQIFNLFNIDTAK